MKLAGKEERILNFLIDGFLIVLISLFVFGLVALFSKSISATDRPIIILTFVLVHFAYYILFEYLTGQTPGKIITYTCVVRKDNSKVRLRDTFLRTLIRLTGIDVYSYLFGTELGMHDKLTNTKVVKDVNKESLAYNKKT